MSPPRNRDRKAAQRRNERVAPGERGKGGGDGELGQLRDAVALRLTGRKPVLSGELLRIAEKNRYKRGNDLRCRNGRSSVNPDCGHYGSQNADVLAAAALGLWAWLVLLARDWIARGLLGKELGSNALLYLFSVLNCIRAAVSHVSGDDRRVLLLVLRAAVGWFALGAIDAPRKHSVVLSTDPQKNRETWHERGEQRTPTAVNAGNRWTAKRDDGDAASAVVRAALADPQAWGLTDDEANTVREAIAGNVEAAKRIAAHVNDGGWLIGTQELPEATWRWVVTRYVDTDGLDVAESVFFGPWPNGASRKPNRSVTRLDSTGEWTSVESVVASGYHVEVDGDGSIVTSDNRGRVVLPALGASVVWRVILEGSKVRFEVPT